MGSYREKSAGHQRGGGLSPDTTTGTMTLDFSASRTVRNRCLLFINHLVYGTLLWQSGGQKQSRMHVLKQSVNTLIISLLGVELPFCVGKLVKK